MEKTDQRETHDFMTVESFSQLPFIRPAPVKERGIKLFGIEFGSDMHAEESESGETNTACEEVKDVTDNGESSRRFECHYCCRNFPTSQALGGHQNAHKRERQHAKRAHLQSAMVHGGLSEAHVYGLMNYRLANSVPTLPMTYHRSWNNNSNAAATTATTYATNTARFYGNHGPYSHPLPINGSPLALLRIPAALQNSPAFNRDHSMQSLPLLATADHHLKPPPLTGSSTSQSLYVYESKPNVQDHVSLDLHL